MIKPACDDDDDTNAVLMINCSGIETKLLKAPVKLYSTLIGQLCFSFRYNGIAISVNCD